MSEYIIPKEYKELYEEWKIKYLFMLVGNHDDALEVFTTKLGYKILPKENYEIDYEEQSKKYKNSIKNDIANQPPKLLGINFSENTNKLEPSEELQIACNGIYEEREKKSSSIIFIWIGWLFNEGLINHIESNGKNKNENIYYTISKKGFDLIYKQK